MPEEELVLVWVEGISNDSVSTCGYVCSLEGLRCQIAAEHAAVMKRSRAELIIGILSKQNPGMTFIIKSVH